MTDARFERTRAIVYQAVSQVLVSEGLVGLTVDRIAAESGIARSTIYRNWPDLAVLACEAFDELMHQESLDLGADPRTGLHDYLVDYARRLNDPTYTAMLVALIEGSWRDDAFAEVHRRAFSQTRSRAASIIRGAQKEGLIDARLDIAQCVEDLVAPFLYRRVVTQNRITPRQVEELYSRLLERWTPAEKSALS
jgi:AcrR family transcriptional regulator